MIIREHCQGVNRHYNPDGWVPQQKWPEDCTVQWGPRGIVFGQPGTTAFFEAFPASPQTFIRGEGATIPEAEADAWAKYERIVACEEHLFQRRGYENGLGFCKHCNLSASVFAPSTTCCKCGVRTFWSKDNTGATWCKTCSVDMPEELWGPTRRMIRRVKDEDDD